MHRVHGRSYKVLDQQLSQSRRRSGFHTRSQVMCYWKELAMLLLHFCHSPQGSRAMASSQRGGRLPISCSICMLIRFTISGCCPSDCSHLILTMIDLSALLRRTLAIVFGGRTIRCTLLGRCRFGLILRVFLSRLPHTVRRHYIEWRFIGLRAVEPCVALRCKNGGDLAGRRLSLSGDRIGSYPWQC